MNNRGVEPPTSEAIEANVRASVEAIKAGQSPSGFDDAKKKGVELSSPGGAAVKPNSDPDLAEAVKKTKGSVKP
jgi:hypothetical protein